MLFLALSCLQGRQMQDAAAELLKLGVPGLQLTPGCAPSEGFEEWLQEEPVDVRTHQGFSFYALRSLVWSPKGELAVNSQSVHPPSPRTTDINQWWDRLEADGVPAVLEVMYPPHVLSSDADLNRIMDLGLGVAVDVSHLHIQRTRGSLSDATLKRMLAYDAVEEIHVSANDGQRDQHQPLSGGEFGLDWAHERLGETPVILESYMHHLTQQQRADVVGTVLR